MRILHSTFYILHSARSRGQVILFVLLIMISLSASALLYNRFFSEEVRNVIVARNSSQALLSADIGLERLMFYLFNKDISTGRCGALPGFEGCQDPYAICTRASPCQTSEGLKYYYQKTPGQIVISSGSYENITRTFLCIECER